MAKRRKLTAPSAEKLTEMEAELSAARPGRPVAPIAQVAAEDAAFAPVSDPRDRADAAALRAARSDGRLIDAIAIDAIEATAMARDRVVIDAGEMRELQDSIQRNGVRLPIEVFRLDAPRGDKTYGLIAGYRRLLAVRKLFEMTEAVDYATIPALVIEQADKAEAMARMVEENEVRAGLSPFERGRIAVLAADQGLFENAQAAVDGLFPVASKSKRSKIRSFAMIFAELGDLIINGDQMQEKQGLRLASALRVSGDRPLREALETLRNPGSFGEEWAALEPVIEHIEANSEPSEKPRGGRPRAAKPGPEWVGDTMRLASGFVITRYTDGNDQLIRISGRPSDQEIGERAVLAIKSVLDLN